MKTVYYFQKLVLNRKLSKHRKKTKTFMEFVFLKKYFFRLFQQIFVISNNFKLNYFQLFNFKICFQEYMMNKLMK